MSRASSHAPPSTMRIRCSYCRSFYAEKEPLTDDSVSHGICPACVAYFGPQWRGQSLGEFLDQFPFPIAALDSELRVVAANAPLAELWNRSRRELPGLRAGEAAECVYARRVEGCGQELHCLRCSVRLSVADTFATGREHVRVPATLELNQGSVAFLVSTRLVEGVVWLTIEELAGRQATP